MNFRAQPLDPDVEGTAKVLRDRMKVGRNQIKR